MSKIHGVMPIIVMAQVDCFCEYCKRDIDILDMDAAEQVIHVYNAPGEMTTETIYECEECREYHANEAQSGYFA